MLRCEVSDQVWAVIGPLFPQPRGTGRPPVDTRMVVEAVVWRFRTGSPWRDVPDEYGRWNTVYKCFNRWAGDGVWSEVLEKVQAMADQVGDIDWVTSIDSTISRVHQHGATLSRDTGGEGELQEKWGGAV